MGSVLLAIAEYRVRLSFGKAGRISSYLGATLRGGFGAMLRQISCVQPTLTSCCQCLLQNSCPYGYLFETPIPRGQPIMKLYIHAPHPLVLRPPLSIRSQVEPGAEAEIAALLVGRASQYFPYVLLALQRLGAEGLGVDRVPFRIQRVAGGDNGTVVYAAESAGPVPLVEPEVFTASVGPPQEGLLAIEFVTPMRLRVNNQVLRQPDFGALVSAALRRLELLARVHSAGEFNIPAPEVAATAREAKLVHNDTCWRDVVRHSRRQGQDMPLGGFVGRAVFAGKVVGLRKLLALAGRVHVGKGTLFGNGYFRVEEVSR